ncbi:glycoside hydrolase family 88 protein [Sphingobacterium alkalisoli]|uniref:Glycoside hydrolase family 88 protein n=1 Tax=Sphingobacterium alkalisoli TaxID=1874115 RepID=A0A4U0H298_9SPHI|nr:glycoside hydrolase family 88 protein [Sphingobacterium alkalisoli]TJY65586.1 glycoside hydrolase family 88 protein [Sphingobacterium alkalisoli]GGH19574.1 hypothetical protein GCM10011418_24110 [Sphingobacterium alkalisoli]
MNKFFLLIFLLIAYDVSVGQNSNYKWQVDANNQPISYAAELTKAVFKSRPFPYKDISNRPKWTYETGVFLEGIRSVWYQTADGNYFNYIKDAMDTYVDKEGNILTYKHDDYNIDNIKTGKTLLLLHNVTGQKKYFYAAQKLRDQLKTHPRTSDGISFWHKKIYPQQVWLDGLYMGLPFLAEWAKLYNEPALYDDIINQFVHIEEKARDSKTGLIYHAWDESKSQLWANKETGNSKHFWGRAMGWYGLALVDVLEDIPQDHPRRKELLDILDRFVESIVRVADPKTGLWYQILDMPSEDKNYLETSASSMFIYTISKAMEHKYIRKDYSQELFKAYDHLIRNFIVKGADGIFHLNGTVSVGGLGGKPNYRDGSYEYYMSEKVVQDDPKGLGAFILAAVEMEKRLNGFPGKDKKVVLDNFFNNEYQNNVLNQKIKYHYIWDEKDNNGFYLFGKQFQDLGAEISTLTTAPTKETLSNANVYIIVDPDTKKETENPNFMDKKSIDVIKNWVKEGGNLLLMTNDYTNAELDHMNKLSEVFGIKFNKDLENTVTGSEFEMGSLSIDQENPVFSNPSKFYLKEVSTLQLKGSAKAIAFKNGKNMIAISTYGKGKVFAVGDPWLYNEYTDGRKLPKEFENFKAAKELAKWLLD